MAFGALPPVHCVMWPAAVQVIQPLLDRSALIRVASSASAAVDQVDQEQAGLGGAWFSLCGKELSTRPCSRQFGTSAASVNLFEAAVAAQGLPVIRAPPAAAPGHAFSLLLRVREHRALWLCALTLATRCESPAAAEVFAASLSSHLGHCVDTAIDN